MFKIKLKDKPDEHFTHNVYYKGKLFAEKGYYDGREFNYEDAGSIVPLKEVKHFRFSELPEYFSLFIYHKAVLHYELDMIRRNGRFIEFVFSFQEKKSKKDMSFYGYVFLLSLEIKKSTIYNSLLRDDSCFFIYCRFIPKSNVIGRSYNYILAELEKCHLAVTKQLKMMKAKRKK